MQNDPLLQALGGKITNSSGVFRSSQVSTLNEENVYSEISFKFLHSSGGSFLLPVRHNVGNGSVVFCSFQVSAGFLNISVGEGGIAGGGQNPAPVVTSLASSDTNLHKAGCEALTDGNDLVINVYLDPEDNPAPVLSHRYISVTAPSGSVAVVLGGTGNFELNTAFRVYRAFPY